MRLIGDGEKGGGVQGVWRRGKREIIYLLLHCHHQNDSGIKTGSDESHFNVSLTVRDKVTRQCPQTTTFEEKGEPKRIRTEVPLLTSPTPYRSAKSAHDITDTTLIVFKPNRTDPDQNVQRRPSS